MKNNIVITRLMFLLITSLRAQTITGRVVDNEGLGLMAATCFLIGDRSKVAISEMDGSWSLKLDSDNLTDTIEIRYLGFENQHIAISQFEMDVQKIITMSSNAMLMSEIKIIAKSPISEDFSVAKIERLDVYFNPLSKADPLNAIQMLPASTDTEESASPSLRGSSPMRSIVIVDGVPIRNPVRYTQLNGTGNFSIFSTELLEKQDVYAGNPPLIYGNSTAGLVDITLRKSPAQDGFMLGASLGRLSAMWNKQSKNEKSFVSAFVNHGISSPFKLVNGNSLSTINSFRNTDIGVRLYSNLSDNMSLSLFNWASTEAYDVNYGLFAYNGNAVGSQVRNYTVAALEWGKLNNHWSINSGTNFSSSDFNYGVVASNISRKDFYTSFNYKRIEEDFVIQTGVNYTWNKDDFNETYPINYYDYNGNGGSFMNNQILSQHDVQSYIYAKYYLGKFTYSASLRTNIPLSDQKAFLSRQLAIKYKFNHENNLLFSTGKYYNYNYPTSVNLNQILMQSKQYALEYQYTTEDLKITVAGYSKVEDNLLERILSSAGIASGSRSIKGLEFSIRKNIGKKVILDLANTFLDIKINTGDFTYSASNDLKYIFKAGLTVFNNDVFNAGLSYITRPGKYYTDIIGGSQGPTEALIPIFDNTINGSQYNTYNNLSLTFNRQISLSDDKSLVFYVVINNILNSKNQQYAVYSNDYTSKDFEYLSRRWLYFGAMLSL